MVRINFNGLNAHDIFNKIVDKTKDFNRTDFSTLNFEAKCEYALSCATDAMPYTRQLPYSDFISITSEIIKRAVNGDAVGLYYLARLDHRIGVSYDDKIEYYKRASDMGYLPATVRYLRVCSNPEERYAIAKELAGKIPSIESIPLRILAIKGCYDTLRRVEGKDKYPHRHDLTHDLYLDLAKDGDVDAPVWLEIIANRKARVGATEAERIAAQQEREFWQTVTFMVTEHYFKLGITKHESSLAYMLMSGSGCERDVEAGIHHALTDMRRTVAMLDRGVIMDTMAHVEARSEKRPLSAKLAAALLEGDDAAVEVIVADFKTRDDVAELFSGASNMLSYGKYQ